MFRNSKRPLAKRGGWLLLAPSLKNHRPSNNLQHANIKQHHALRDALSDLRFIPSSSSSNRRYRNGMVEPGRAADGAVVDRVGEIADVLDSGAVGPGVGYSSFFAPARGRSVSSWTGRWTTRSAAWEP